MNIQRDNGKITPLEFCERLNSDHISQPALSFAFCGNSSQYEWNYAAKRRILVPFAEENAETSGRLISSVEEREVWIVDGLLHRGESNLLARRRFFLDEESWLIVYGEGFDNTGAIMKFYMLSRPTASTPQFEGRWYPV